MNIKKCKKKSIYIEDDYKCTAYQKINGTLTFWCKSCNNLINVKVKIDNYFSLNYENNPEILYHVEPKIRCCKCNREMIELDPNIANAIIKLNNKGYKTEYCCEGYHRDTDILPYIYFKDNIRKYVEEYNLEYPWYIDERLDQGKIIRANRYNESYSDQELVLQKLYEWINRLPNKEM